MTQFISCRGSQLFTQDDKGLIPFTELVFVCSERSYEFTLDTVRSNDIPVVFRFVATADQIDTLITSLQTAKERMEAETKTLVANVLKLDAQYEEGK